MFEGIPVGVLTPSALLGVGILMVLRGYLVPRRVVEDLKERYQRELDDTCHDRDEWRAAHRISETARVDQSKQVERLLEVGNTVDLALNEIRQEAMKRKVSDS